MSKAAWIGPVILSVVFLAQSCGSPGLPDRLQLRDSWHFRYDSARVGMEQEWHSEPLGAQQWIRVPPGSYWDENYDGWGWYRQEVWLPEPKTDRKIALVIESVDDNAKVWFNDSLIIEHQGANEQLYADITALYKPGKENSIAIMVEDLGGPGGLNGKVYIRKYLKEIDLLKGTFYDAESIESPRWVQEAVIYEIFVRSFSGSGDFDGVRKRLDELQSLGVNTLWLMPVHPIGEEKRKGSLGSPYSVKDYYTVHPDCGTREDFRRLVYEAHRRDMHLILDMVLNHSAWDNPLVEEHPEWYTRNAAGEIVSPNADWTDVADFNYENDELRRYMIAMLKFWVEEYDVDGFRFDVAGLVPADFWKDAREELEQVKPDIFFLAEDSQPEMHVTAFDMTYSWNIYWGLVTMLQDMKPAGYIEEVYKRERYKYPQDALRMRFTENHDEARAAKLLTKPQAFAAAVYVNTIPGVPMLYNGQEIGATQWLSLFERNVIDWEEGDADYRKHYQRLHALRREHPVLIDGKFRRLSASPGEAVKAFTRRTEAATLLTVINFNGSPVDVNVPLEHQSERLEAVYLRKADLQLDAAADRVAGTLGACGWGIYLLGK